MLAAAFGLTALMLLLGAGRAAATHSVLCKENVATCSAGSQYPAESELQSAIEGPGVYGEIEFSGLTISACKTGKMSGTALVQKEGPITGEVFNFYMNNCQPETCRMSTESPAFPWKVEAIGGGDGAIAIPNPLITVTCAKSPWIFNCKYKASSLNAELEGGPVEEAFIQGAETTFTLVSGTGCFYTAGNLRFRYLIRGPAWENPLYVTN